VGIPSLLAVEGMLYAHIDFRAWLGATAAAVAWHGKGIDLLTRFQSTLSRCPFSLSVRSEFTLWCSNAAVSINKHITSTTSPRSPIPIPLTFRLFDLLTFSSFLMSVDRVDYKPRHPDSTPFLGPRPVIITLLF
jgi:hypothetical protein